MNTPGSPAAEAQTLFGDAVRLAREGRLDEAEALYRHCLDRWGESAELRYNLGLALHRRGRPGEAIPQYERAVALMPGHADALVNIGAAYQETGATDAALHAARRAAALAPGHALAHCLLAALLLETGELEQACAESRAAIRLDPGLAPARFNLGAALNAQNRLDDAAEAFARAIRLKPDFAAAHFCLGHVLLLQGRFTEGWAEFEWRWNMPEYAHLRRDYGCPAWDGGDLEGRTLLIHGEIGLGDAILFARFIPLATRKGGPVVLAADERLTGLFSGFSGVRTVPVGEAPQADLHCPLLSLPRVLGITLDDLPRAVPYLEPGRHAPRRRDSGAPLRVGVVWAGNPAHRGDVIRSPGLAAMAPLFAIPGIDFVSLQVGDVGSAGLPPHVTDAGAGLSSLQDTAQVMHSLDLVISSCTAPLHLAAALGVPAWGLIPFAPYFPWMFVPGENPWYPAIRLYRQKRRGVDWAEVIGDVVKDLGILAGA